MTYINIFSDNFLSLNVAKMNKEIKNIRVRLDQLDNKLLKIIKKRLHLVDKVLKNKEFKKDIIDKKRINIILRNIQKKSIKMNIDKKVTGRIWASIIKACIDYEFRKFKKK